METKKSKLERKTLYIYCRLVGCNARTAKELRDWKAHKIAQYVNMNFDKLAKTRRTKKYRTWRQKL